VLFSFMRSTRMLAAFIRLAGLLLLLTALAKILSGFGHAKLLQLQDPLFALRWRYLFFLVGTVEAAVAVFCLLSNKQKATLGMIAWFSTACLLYRFGIRGLASNCPCLGTLTDALHLAPDTADLLLKMSLGYLLLGSYWGLLRLWREQRGAAATASSGTNLRCG
jgi:hypothetical protein